MTNTVAKTAGDPADGTDLAAERTAMAANRTLMAWVRTALSMISFGFTIYKFLQGALKAGEIGLLREHGPRRFGLFLIMLGIVSVVFGAIEYVQTMRWMNRRVFSLSLVMGLLIGALGLLLLVSILSHKELF